MGWGRWALDHVLGSRFRGSFSAVKERSVLQKVRARAVLVDDLPPGALPTPAELKKLHKLADKVLAGKAKIRYLSVGPASVRSTGRRMRGPKT